MADYDIIVVGSGAAGGPLAARLSEEPGRRVLLLEAGPAPASTEEFPPDLLNPGLMTGYFPDHPHNWNYEAQLTEDRPVAVSRGRILGGSTSLNGTYFTRARRRDFEEYAALGNDEWSYEKVLPFYIRLEHDHTFGDRDGHGTGGPVPVSRAEEEEYTIFTKAFVQACLDAGYPWEEDKNADGPPGIGPVPTNTFGGVRMSTGLTYINPVRHRPNLEVWGDSFVRRVTLDGTVVTGVEVSRGGRTESVTASEVVLAAGAFNSPHLLALSGIGPRAELESAGVPVIVDLPGVGKQFSDHPSVPFYWTPRFRLDDSDLVHGFQTALHLCSEGAVRDDGDIELQPMLRPLAEMLDMDRGDNNDLCIAITLQHCEARGELTTISSDPLVRPRIEYHYLEHEGDRARLREAVRISAELLTAPSFEEYFESFVDIENEVFEDDHKLDAWIRDHLNTGIHATATCRMGDDPASGDVVDQYGKVHGISGLRVGDTSILPFAPWRGPAATATLIGERIAAFIAGETATAQSEAAT